MNTLEEKAIAFTKELTHLYFIDRDFEKILSKCHENISWIGTGKNKICKNISDILYLFDLDKKSHNINFKIQNEWYHTIPISDTICIVLGEIVFNTDLSNKTLKEVPSCFSLICKIGDNDEMKLIHIHNSVPSMEQQKQKELELEKIKYQIIAEQSNNILFEYDIEMNIMIYCKKYKEITGRDIIITNYIETVLQNNLVYKPDVPVFLELMDKICSGTKFISKEFRIKIRDNSYKWVRFQSSTLFHDSKPIKSIGKIINIDSEKRENESLKLKAQLDPLTKLYNKMVTQSLITNCFKTIGNKGIHAFMILDIDNFKSINDNLGHIFGDSVLSRTSINLKNTFYKSDIIGRIGGDEFVILLKNINSDNLIEKKANDICNIFKNTYIGENNDFKISCSIGISIYPKDGTTYNKLFKKADHALYMSKKRGKDCFEIYNKMNTSIYNTPPSMKITEEEKIESLMVSALKNKEFSVYLQPKVELSTKKIIGAEALVRWLRPNHNIIMPIEFIPLFEKNGFIIDLDFYVYEETFKLIRSCLDSGKPIVPVSINVSRVHINDNTFIPNLVKLIKKYDIPTNIIELELTESIFLENIEKLMQTINQLKIYGFTLSIDDFGSGYSSLILLKDLPIDVLKLDKGFFPHENISNKEKIIISNIVRMAKELNITVLSEGVETQEQVDFLNTIGCNLAQGYLFYKPMPINEFKEKFCG